MKIYLDNCCNNRPYDDQSTTTVSLEAQAKLGVQEMICDGEIELVSSFMLLVRNCSDYTEWQRCRFDDMGEEELFEAAVAYNEARPFYK